MQELNSKETINFLKPYYQGILKKGLLDPLLEIANSGTGKPNRAARTFYDAQATGILPQVAIKLMKPRLPFRVELLFGVGFEQSRLDYVLEDVIHAYQSNIEIEALDQALDNLLDKYSHLTTEEICSHCSISEIRKLIRRAEMEQANTVIVYYRDGYLVQKFLSAKLVEVREAAIPAVYKSFKQVFAKDRVVTGEDFKISIIPLLKSQYKVKSKKLSFRVLFDD